MSVVEVTSRAVPELPSKPPATSPATTGSTSTEIPATSATCGVRPESTFAPQPPAITSDTFRGHFYIQKCRVAERYNIQWQPKEPQDELWRIFCDLVIAIHRKASVQKVKRILAIFASKGGSGKTPTAANLAVLLKVASNASALLGDFNHNTGTTGDRTGVSRAGEGVKLLFDILDDPSLIKDHDTATDHFPKHESGLDILMSNTGKANVVVEVKRVIDVIFMLKAAYYSVILDTGNGNVHEINEGAMFTADVAGFTVMAEKLDQFTPLIVTLMEFASLGHQAKVFASPKIICATKKEHTAQMFFELFKEKAWEHLNSYKWTYKSPWGDQIPKRTEGISDEDWQAQLVDQLLKDHGITEEKIFLVPFSDYIDKNGIVSLKRRTTGMPALIAYARIVLYMLEIEVPSVEDKKRHIESILESRIKDKEELARKKAAEAREAALRRDLDRVAEEAREKGTGPALTGLIVKYKDDIQMSTTG